MDPKDTPTNGDTPKPGNEGGQGGKGEEPKTFTQEDLDRVLQDRLAKEQERFEKKLSEKIKAERDDWERQARLSEDEKAKELLEKQQKEFAERERNVTVRENRASAIEKFAELELPIGLVDFVVDTDIEQQSKKTEALKEAYNKAVEQGIANKLKGNAPKDINQGNSKPGEKKIITTF